MKYILLCLIFLPCMMLGMDLGIYDTGDHIGDLTVICGPMYSGKTEELIRRVHTSRIQLLNTIVCKHQFDTRLQDQIISKGDHCLATPAYPIIDPMAILDIASEAQVVAIDEVQFFNKDMVLVVKKLLDKGIDVIASGLDMDFKKEPFGECMPSLLCMATQIIKMKAVCSVCRKYNAVYSQRLVNGEPANQQDNVVIVDDGRHPVTYEPRCKDCHVMNLRRSKSLNFIDLCE